MTDAIEGRDISTADILGDFLQKYYNKGDTHIKIERKMVTITKDINLS